MHTVLLIACKNEERTIGALLPEAKKYVKDIVVLDGRSSDSSAKIARESGVEVVADAGRGKGAALRRAFEERDGDVFVTMDADGSHDPKDIPALMRPILEGQADLVIGSRLRGGSEEFVGDLEKTIRVVGSLIITYAINKRFGAQITDSQNGFRAIRAETARKLKLNSNSTTIEQEMLAKTLKIGGRVVEVPSHENARSFGRSHIRLLRDWPKYLWSLMIDLV
ncbi:MAG TPA: glycosyltransferase family 2 protein [Elusimicrobiota bacterium]|nr:glycosyltransferase family 2 protein [Elusimicrobiota bacterium]